MAKSVLGDPGKKKKATGHEGIERDIKTKGQLSGDAASYYDWDKKPTAAKKVKSGPATAPKYKYTGQGASKNAGKVKRSGPTNKSVRSKSKSRS